MKAAIRLFTAALFVVPVVAADPPGFALWRATELAQRDQLLSKRVGGDHSARETLADYGDATASGCSIEMLMACPSNTTRLSTSSSCQSGEGMLLLGGKMINSRASSGTGSI